MIIKQDKKNIIGVNKTYKYLKSVYASDVKFIFYTSASIFFITLTFYFFLKLLVYQNKLNSVAETKFVKKLQEESNTILRCGGKILKPNQYELGETEYGYRIIDLTENRPDRRKWHSLKNCYFRSKKL